MPKHKIKQDRRSSWIRNLRRSRGLTQQEFAHALGVTLRTVASWESHQYAPSALSLDRIRAFQQHYTTSALYQNPTLND